METRDHSYSKETRYIRGKIFKKIAKLKTGTEFVPFLFAQKKNFWQEFDANENWIPSASNLDIEFHQIII